MKVQQFNFLETRIFIQEYILGLHICGSNPKKAKCSIKDIYFN